MNTLFESCQVKRELEFFNYMGEISKKKNRISDKLNYGVYDIYDIYDVYDLYDLYDL